MSREVQVEHKQFLDERPLMKRGSVWATERIHHETDELYEEIVDDPNLWERAAIAGEIADIFLFLSSVADNYGINILEEARKKIEINRQRFPAHEFQEGDYHEAYTRVKQREGRAQPIDIYTPSVNLTEDPRLGVD